MSVEMNEPLLYTSTGEVSENLRGVLLCFAMDRGFFENVKGCLEFDDHEGSNEHLIREIDSIIENDKEVDKYLNG